MREADEPSTRMSQDALQSVRAPPGAVMVAPQMLSRNTWRAHSEGRATEVLTRRARPTIETL